ncbi:MAG: sel1 repeat family protein [Succinivibrionaceae bacterium]|nr:sel1 repeat family protein [Succinivibrionaceae bacterium]
MMSVPGKLAPAPSASVFMILALLFGAACHGEDADGSDSASKRRLLEQKCLENGSAIIVDNRKDVDRTGAFSACMHAASGGNPVVWYFIGHMQLNAIGAKADIAGGLKWLGKAAEDGLPIAQKELADYYITGGGIRQKISMKDALDWLSRLATNRNEDLARDAALRLCSIYIFGPNVEPDYERAFTWCRKSGIEQKNYDGLTNLALLYINGWGAEKNVPLAMDYYTTAANSGVISAQLSLGRAYSIGQDVPVDYGKAFFWMEKAASQNSPQGMYYLAQMYEYGQGTQQDDKKAWQFYRKAAEAGEMRAQYTLGRLYQYSPSSNIDSAAKWYHKAAASGNTDAMIAIGDLYSIQNHREMMKWYAAAAAGGSSDGKLRMIPYLLKGSRDLKPDPAKALAYALELAQSGNSGGLYWTGLITLKGLAGEQDLAAAYEALTLSAREGNADAALELGKALIIGAFGEKDPELGEKYLLQASENGCVNDACLELARLYLDTGEYQKADSALQEAKDALLPDQKEEYLRLLKTATDKLSEKPGGSNK